MRFGMWSFFVLVGTVAVGQGVFLTSSVCADTAASACGNGGQGASYGYACPHMMMLTDEMIRAAQQDRLDDAFVYAVAGGAQDSDCGKCFQVQLLDAEREWRDDFPYLIVQIVNSGFDVLGMQLDLFMGGGGFGYFTACNADCQRAYCQGGACRQGMYEGSFREWVDAEYDDPNLCYSGGIKWLDHKNDTELERLCRRLSHDTRNHASNATTQSCLRTNRGLFHQNFVSTRYSRVRCPPFLIRTTGLHRLDDNPFPDPSAGLVLSDGCQGSRTQGHYCVTTMQDCCKMSCSWSGKIPSYAFDPTWPCISTCDREGTILGGTSSP